MEHSDAQLAVAAGQGDVAAFGTLVDRLRGPLVAYLFALVGRQDEAEELAQEACLGRKGDRHIFRKNVVFDCNANWPKNEPVPGP